MLQAIAAQNNLSETAFYAPEGEDFRLRWFTPLAEVDLCGHATLATAYVIFCERPELKRGITFHTRSGPLQVTSEGDIITMDFPATPIQSTHPPQELVDALGIRPIECYTGCDYLAILPNESALREVRPDFRLLQALDQRGVIITAPVRRQISFPAFLRQNMASMKTP